MKSPSELKRALRSQWENADTREKRLLGAEGSFPIKSTIGIPPVQAVSLEAVRVKKHIDAWKCLPAHQVVWEEKKYQSLKSTVKLPIKWVLQDVSEWIQAIGDADIRRECDRMLKIIENTDPSYHSLFIRRRSLWKEKPIDEVLRAARLAMSLSPLCAEGRPLRLISYDGTDTKFFERNAQLMTALLDVRFDDEVGRIGLADFLGAFREDDHWLLVVDLDGSLLPFKKLRVQSSEEFLPTALVHRAIDQWLAMSHDRSLEPDC